MSFDHVHAALADAVYEDNAEKIAVRTPGKDGEETTWTPVTTEAANENTNLAYMRYIKRPITFIFLLVLVIVFIGGCKMNYQMSNIFVFHISSNFDGSKTIFRRLDKKKSFDWDIYISDESLKLNKFDFFGSLYVNGLIFTKTNGEFIVSERTKEGHQAWKYNHEKKEREKIMLFDGSGYFFSLENNGLLFLGVSLTLDSGRRGYDWFVSYPNQGTKKISDERYYYYPTPFFIKNSIAGFAEKNLGSEEDLAKLGKKYGEYSLEYVNLSSNIDAEQKTKKIKDYLSVSKSKDTPCIQCEEEGNACIISNTMADERGKFWHELYLVNDLGRKKLNIELKRIEGHSISGDGKWLFVVGKPTIYSNEYLFQKYSLSESGDCKLISSVNAL